MKLNELLKETNDRRNIIDIYGKIIERTDDKVIKECLIDIRNATCTIQSSVERLKAREEEIEEETQMLIEQNKIDIADKIAYLFDYVPYNNFNEKQKKRFKKYKAIDKDMYEEAITRHKHQQ